MRRIIGTSLPSNSIVVKDPEQLTHTRALARSKEWAKLLYTYIQDTSETSDREGENSTRSSSHPSHASMQKAV